MNEREIIVNVEHSCIASVFSKGIRVALERLELKGPITVTVSEVPEGAEYWISVERFRELLWKRSFFGPVEVDAAFIESALVDGLSR